MARELIEVMSSNASMSVDVHSLHLTDDQFYQLCMDNGDLRFELTSRGELIIMPPTSSMTGWRNSQLHYQVAAWSRSNGTGLTFDSSAGFTLPNGAKRSPDTSWIRRKRWDALTTEEQEAFAPICPDFVVELRSPTDHLSTLQNKMVEYIENGAQLGWLLDPQSKSIHVYRPGQTEEKLDDPETVSADSILPGFVLQVREIW
jgi:Uma2 family endonuclease